MSDGTWNGQRASESIQQPISRHSMHMAELGAKEDLMNFQDFHVASWQAARSPNDPYFDWSASNNQYAYGGPHFIMSPETPDNKKTLGLEWCLLSGIVSDGLDANRIATPLVGGFTVTLWCMIANTQSPDGKVKPIWASLLPETGVGFNQLYHSFDINVAAIRFQIGNGTSIITGANSGALMLAMCEL